MVNGSGTTRRIGFLRERPGDAVLWLLCCLYLGTTFSEIWGRWGVLASLPVGAILTYGWLRLLARRYPLWTLPEIGPVEMDLPDYRPTGTFSLKATRTLALLAGAFCLLAFCLALMAALTEANPHIAGNLVGMMLYGSILLVSLRTSRWQMLVAARGLFRVTDPRRPWVTNGDVREPSSRLRAVRIYAWDQIEKFHTSGHPDAYFLHLAIRFPQMRVPQLISYSIPSLSEEERERLEEVLRQHVPESVSVRESVAV